MRARSLGSPEKGYHHSSQFHPHLHRYPPPHGALGKSASYTSGPGAPAMREGGVEFQQRHHGYPSSSNLIHAPKDEIQMKSYSRTNGQPRPHPFSSYPPSHSSQHSSNSSTGPASPSALPRPPPGQASHSAPLSPASRGGGGVKKVSGVGGTTYEISV